MQIRRGSWLWAGLVLAMLINFALVADAESTHNAESNPASAHQTSAPPKPHLISAADDATVAHSSAPAAMAPTAAATPRRPVVAAIEAEPSSAVDLDATHQHNIVNSDPEWDQPVSNDELPQSGVGDSDELVVLYDAEAMQSDAPKMDAFASNEGVAAGFMLADAVSTNSGINGIPEMPIGQTFVSMVGHAADLQMDHQLEAEPDPPAVYNKTNAPTLIPLEPTQIHPDQNHYPADEPLEIPEVTLQASPTTSQIDMINDSGGTSTADEPLTALDEPTDETQIPLFSEWAQKRMEEVEKEQEQDAANSSTQKKNQTAGQKIGTTLKNRSKNYASPDCGAKIIASNSESSNTRAVLTLTKDEYLLSPCTSRIWFVVELCEAIQAEMIDLANFELFSSSPKNFSIGVANRFPTRDWSQVGKFNAQDARDIQSFDLDPHLFGKYVRVDIHSHYNSEHFCPISLFRVFGTSEFEAFETENRLAADDDDDDGQDEDEDAQKKEDQNIFRSASDAVMSMVKKAAATFVKPNDNRTGDVVVPVVARLAGPAEFCVCPRFEIMCKPCSSNLTAAVTELVTCKNSMLRDLLNFRNVRLSLFNSPLCSKLIGIDLMGSTDVAVRRDDRSEWMLHMLPTRYVAAMCNLLASDQNVMNEARDLGDKEARDVVSNVTIDKKGSEELNTPAENTILPTDSDGEVEFKEIIDSSTEDGNTNEDAELPDEDHHIPTQIQPPPSLVEPIEMVAIEEPVPADPNESDRNYIFEGDLTEKDAEEFPTDPSVDVINSMPNTLSELSDRKLQEIADNLLNVALPATTASPPIVEATPAEVSTSSTEELALANGAGIAVINSGGHHGSSGQKVQSESVFLRLSNRVKSLERNMSLSGQYLEELSRRYKKQVEELQLVFSKTLLVVEEQNKRSHDREQQLFEQNEKLRDDLDALTEKLFSWRTHFAYGCSMLCVQFAVWLVKRLWRGGRKRDIKQDDGDEAPDIVSNPDRLLTRAEKLRRKSMDGSTGHIGKITKKRRRPSEEALHIAGTYADLMIDGVYEVSPDTEEYDSFVDPNDKKRRAAKQRRLIVKRTASMDTHSNRERKNGVQRLQSAPAGYFQSLQLDHSDAESTPGSEPVLDEDYEVYVPGSDMAYNEFMPDGPSGQSSPLNDQPLDNPSNTNGAADTSTSSLSSKKSSEKLRRLSSPAFLKSPFARSLSGAGKKKKSGQGDATGWEWYRLRKDSTTPASSQTSNSTTHNQSKKGKKSKSESPLKNRTTDEMADQLRPSSSATTLSLNSVNSTPIIVDKKQGSFRRILRKVF